MDTTVIELDALANAVRPAAQDGDLFVLGRTGFIVRRARAVALVARIHVAGLAGKLAGTGIDPLVDRPHP